MTVSAARFAEILTTAVRTLKAFDGQNLEAIHDELGYAVGRDGGSFIHYLRKGHLPSAIEDVVQLARELVRRRALTLQTCEQFLESAGHPQPRATAVAICDGMDEGHMGAGAITQDQAFVAGPPITKPRQFFGRTREVSRVFEWWRRFPMTHVTLIGPRRSGKTSLLHYLRAITTAASSERRPDQRTDWLPKPNHYRWVWVDFHDPRMRLRERLLTHLLTGCGIAVPQPCTLETFTDAMERHRWKTPCIVLMDELERALASPELDQDFWHCLRALLNSATQGNLAFALSAHEPPHQLAEASGKTSPFFNMFQTLELGPLTEAEARELIASSPLPFAADDTEWIITRSGCWPWLLQILCQERLNTLQHNETGEEWRQTGLSRIAPYQYLLTVRRGAP